MTKLAVRHLLLLAVLIVGCASRVFSQTITIGTVDPGPYVPGSTIAIPFHIDNGTSFIDQTNAFTLYMSDASGSFASATAVATLSATAYATYFNYTIPAALPAGTGYKFEIKASVPAITSAASAAITVNATGTAATAGASNGYPPTNSSYPDVYANCSNPQTGPYYYTNSSTGALSTYLTIYNETTQAYVIQNMAIGIYPFSPQNANYTVTVKAVTTSGVVSTKAYTFINNKANSSLPSSGNNTVCLSSGGVATLTFGVDYSSASGVQFNYPGDVYTYTWGDGSTSTYTLAQIIALGGVVSHNYTRASCGNVANGQNNVFEVDLDVNNKICGHIGTRATSYANIVISPTNYIAPITNDIACTGTAVTFTNGSVPGPDPNASSASCADNPNALYSWYVDGTLVQANYHKSQDFVYTFTTNGSHTILLRAQNGNGVCTAPDYSYTICVQNPPQPSLTLPAGPVCSTSGPFTPVNTSVVDNSCGTTPTYQWTITPNTYTLSGGTNLTSATAPQINFTQPDTYTVGLSITTSCGTYTATPKSIIVDTPPTVTLSSNATFCGTTQTLIFDGTTGSSTKVTYAGSAAASTVTYAWTITPPGGGSYSFTGGTSATSQYPKIQFTGAGAYSVSVIASNSCGPSTAQTETITLQQAPTVDAGSAQTICQGNTVNLAGTITGTYNTSKWSSPTNTSGSAFGDVNNLTTTYTPTAADISNGSVTLTLTVQTGLVGACATVTAQVTITIIPTDHITSAATKKICSGSNVGYTITASDASSTYNWTAAVTSGAATGFSASGTSATINDVIVNSNLTTDAVITYTVTPTSSLSPCPGTPFTFAVTIPATPTITPNVANAVICSGSPTGISFTSNQTGTKYTWNVSMPAGVTGGNNVVTQTSSATITDVLTNNSTTTATVTYAVTAYNSTGCAGTPFNVSVNVAPAPTVANAGPDQTLCGATTTTLAANNPTVGIGKWTVISGSGVTFNDDTSPTTVITGLTIGSSYRLQWTITSGTNCTSISVVNISVIPATVPGTTAAVGASTVCSPTNTGQIRLTGQTGSIIRWESSTDGGTTWQTIAVTTTTLTFSNLTQTTQYRAVVQNGSCTVQNSNATTISVNQPPPAANAGANQTICAATVAVLNGSNPGTFTGVWTQTSGPAATISNPNNNVTTVTGLTGGNNYTFVWTIQGVSPCVNSQAQMTITDNAATVAGTTAATGSSSVCAGTNSGQINLTGQVGNVLRWESSTDGGTTWAATIANTSPTINYANLTQTTEYRAVVQNGNCNVQNSNATVITVNQSPPAANAGPDQNLCNTTVVTLAANNPGAYTGVWTQTAGPAANIADVNNPNTSVSGLTGGSTYTFVWTIQAVAPCVNTTSQVNIINAPMSVGGTTSASGATSVCAGSNSGQINLTGQTGGVIRWEASTDGGTTWTTLTNTTASITYSNLTQTTVYRAVVQSGACSMSTSATTTITVNQSPPAANAGADQAVCAVSSVTLTANNPGTFNGIWAQTSGPATTITSPNSFQTTVTGLVGGNNYTFTWTILASAPCVNTTAQVNVINAASSVGGTTAATGATTVCAGNNSGQINLTGQLGNILNWQSSTDGGTTWQTIVNGTATISFTNITQTTQYRAVVQNGTCSIVYSTATIITVNQSPPTANAGTDQTLCGLTTTTLTGNNPGTYTGVWTQVAGPAATIVNPNSFNTAINGLVDGNTYTFIWTIDGQAPCVNSQSQVNIIVTPATAGGSTASANGNSVCSGSNTGQINLTGQVGNVLRWESSVDNGTTWQPIASNNTNITFTNLTQTTQYRAVVQSGTCAVLMSAVTTITVYPPAPVADAGTNQILCNTSTTALNAANPGTFTGVWQQTSGPAVTFANPNDPKTAISGLIGGNSYSFTWTIQAQAPCTNTQSQVTVTDNPDVVASFTKTPASGCGNLTVQFTNTSNNQTGANFQWDFGDGSTSTSVSPQHTFGQRNDGRDTVYKIGLTVPGNCVTRGPVLDSVLVRPATPLAQILPVNATGCGNFTLDVRNVSPGNNVSYDFYLYDGATLVQKISKTDKSDAIFNPITTTAKKTFTLYMIATGYCNNTGETLHIPITISPSTVVAQMFSDNNVTAGCVPLTVTFLNNSFGGDSFHYNIYDSNGNIVEQPIAGLAALPYTFSTAGTFYVTITATNSCGTQESPRTQFTVYPLPTPAFAANDTVGCKNVTVTFINNTNSNNVNTPATSLSYDWNFGDGSTHSAAFQPTHTFKSAGSPYTITLTVTNITSGCSNVTSKVNYIQVEAPPGTNFIAEPDSIVSIPNYKFSFVDKTTGAPISWKWTFSDGQTSTSRNPQITFADTGKYKVTLTTTNKDGCDSTLSKTVQITGVPGQLYLPNAFIPTSATVELKTFMAKGSGIKTWLLQIFNAYGALVWQTNKLSPKGEPVEGWDGTYKGVPAPQGVYVWQAQATFINGTEWKGMSYSGSLPNRVGSVHLIR